MGPRDATSGPSPSAAALESGLVLACAVPCHTHIGHEGEAVKDGAASGSGTRRGRRRTSALLVVGLGLMALRGGTSRASEELTVVVTTEPRERDLGALLVDADQIIDEVLMAEAGETAERGAVLLGVEQRGPAARAGLEPADAIVELGGERVFVADDLWRILGARAVGSRVPVTFVRDGRVRTSRLEVTGRVPPALRPPGAGRLFSMGRPPPKSVNGW